MLGLGKFGTGVADELMERGAEVLVVDRNERLIEQHAGKYTQAVIADLADVEQIKDSVLAIWMQLSSLWLRIWRRVLCA